MYSTRLALVASVLGVAPCLAQGSAPNQGSAQPSTPPILAQPPTVDPASVSDGRPRPDTGGGNTSTAPDTTAGTRVPSPAEGEAPAAGATQPGR